MRGRARRACAPAKRRAVTVSPYLVRAPQQNLLTRSATPDTMTILCLHGPVPSGLEVSTGPPLVQ